MEERQGCHVERLVSPHTERIGGTGVLGVMTDLDTLSRFQDDKSVRMVVRIVLPAVGQY